ncbi:MAG: nitrogen regulation protein NR(I) [Lysobacteraceae bacterium]|nr:MAG: nitrogen regulation protein NR(I) [Xanthomonadaceae bacterium]
MTTAATIWIVDDDDSIRWVSQQALSDLGDVHAFANAEDAMRVVKDHRPDVVITDVRMPGANGLELLAWLNEEVPKVPVIIVTAFADLEATVQAYTDGAYDHLSKPFDIDQLADTVARALTEQKIESNAAPELDHGFVGESQAMQDVFRSIGRLARTQLNVLISGETGVGKELVAHALHRHSPRCDGPFVAINTAAIPDSLLESELFGHEKGAFTGADAQQAGRFEQANGGTLFLDEIGDMPETLQTRLLRVLAEGEFYRVGGRQLVTVDVRVIAATHRNLVKRVKEGQFREDLLHRLDVVSLRVPPLRERPEDIAHLAALFFKEAAAETGLPQRHLTNAALNTLQAHQWPGNVRELKNMCYNLTVMASGREIRPDDLPNDYGGTLVATNPPWVSGLRRWADSRLTEQSTSEQGVLERAQHLLEKTLILSALNQTGGRKAEAAKLLGLGRNTLTRKLKDYGLDL